MYIGIRFQEEYRRYSRESVYLCFEDFIGRRSQSEDIWSQGKTYYEFFWNLVRTYWSSEIFDNFFYTSFVEYK